MNQINSSELYEPNQFFNCFIYDLIEYANITFPFYFSDDPIIQDAIFTSLVKNYTLTDKGKEYLAQGNIGYFENEEKIKFISISWKINEAMFETAAVKDVSYQIWEGIMNQYNDIANNNGIYSMNNGYQTSPFAWAWSATESGIIESAIRGVAIAGPCALGCLIISTQNWIVSIFAISSIACIVVTELAFMKLMGWELGIAESIAVIIMIGFSVDYVVHLGNAYVESHEKDRNDKIKYALYTMGISVVSGGMTTFGSGFWLIFPEMLFFYKFGLLVMTVVIWALFYALIYFISILSICGPTGKRGYIPIYQCLSPLINFFGDMCIRLPCCCCCGTINGNEYQK